MWQKYTSGDTLFVSMPTPEKKHHVGQQQQQQRRLQPILNNDDVKILMFIQFFLPNVINYLSTYGKKVSNQLDVSVFFFVYDEISCRWCDHIVIMVANWSIADSFQLFTLSFFSIPVHSKDANLRGGHRKNTHTHNICALLTSSCSAIEIPLLFHTVHFCSCCAYTYTYQQIYLFYS